jgi:hypothetical protein
MVAIPELGIKNSKLAERVIKILQTVDNRFDLALQLVKIADEHIRSQTARELPGLSEGGASAGRLLAKVDWIHKSLTAVLKIAGERREPLRRTKSHAVKDGDHILRRSRPWR